MGACVAQDAGVVRKYLVEIIDQRLDLPGEGASDTLCMAFMHRCQRFSQIPQWAQTNQHLNDHADDQPEAQRSQRPRKQTPEPVDRFGNQAGVRRNDQTQRLLRSLSGINHPLDHLQRQSTRALYPVLVDDTIGGRIVRHQKHMVPQGSGAEHSTFFQRLPAVQSIDLPIQTGVGAAQARVAQRGCEIGFSVLIDRQIRGELLEMTFQPDAKLLRDMPVKQPGKPPAGNGNRDNYPGQGPRQQADPQGPTRKTPSPHSGHVRR